jgi:hypothetical protein
MSSSTFSMHTTAQDATLIEVHPSQSCTVTIDVQLDEYVSGLKGIHRLLEEDLCECWDDFDRKVSEKLDRSLAKIDKHVKALEKLTGFVSESLGCTPFVKLDASYVGVKGDKLHVNFKTEQEGGNGAKKRKVNPLDDVDINAILSSFDSDDL